MKNSVRKFIFSVSQRTDDFSRLIFFSGLIICISLQDTNKISKWGYFFDNKKITPFNFIFDPSVLYILKVTFIISAFMLAISYRTKIFSSIMFISGSLFLWIMHSHGYDQIYHHYQLIWFSMLAFVFYEYKVIKHHSDLIFALKGLLLSVFCIAGITKLRHAGLSWYSDPALESFLLSNRVTIATPITFFDFNLFAIKNISVFNWFYYLVLPFEILAPLGMFKNFKFMIYLFAIFQLMSFLFLYVSFYEYIPIYIICIMAKNNDLK